MIYQMKSRKILSFILLLAMMLSLVPDVGVHAEGLTDGDWSYVLLDETSAEITGYSGSGTELTFPSEVGGYKVVKIGNDAFMQNTAIKKAVIPEGVTIIGERTFGLCTSLTSVTLPSTLETIDFAAFAYSGISGITLPDKLKTIEDWAFAACEELTSIVIPKSVTLIGSEVFMGCGKLASLSVDAENTIYSSEGNIIFNKNKTEVVCCAGAIEEITLPTSIKTIPDYTFCDITSLKKVTLPNTITTIGLYAFSGCINLTSITLPDSLTGLGYYAFDDCISLKTVNIPKNLTVLLRSTFSGCSALESFTVSADNPAFAESNGLILNKDKTELVETPKGKKSITIPSGVTKIRDNAFYECEKLESVSIPNSVTHVGREVFGKCTKLQSITIPDSVNYLGDSAFRGCSELSQINLSENLTYIGSNVIYETAYEKNNFDENKCLYVGPYFIDAKQSVTELNIKEGTLGAAEDAFYGLYSLTKLTLPSTIKNLNGRMFFELRKLTDISVAEKGAYIFTDGSIITADNKRLIAHLLNRQSNSDLANSELASYTVPNGIETIDNSAFRGCYIKQILLPNTVRNIGFHAFYQCYRLTSITIPEGVKHIDTYTFYSCPQLVSIDLPSTIEKISAGAFDFCYKFTTVNYNGTKYEWNKIDISDDDNEALFEATKNFAVTAETHTRISDAGPINVNVENIDNGSEIIIAFYDENGMVDVFYDVYEGENLSFPPTTKLFTKARVFAWDSLDEMWPVADPEDIELSVSAS